MMATGKLVGPHHVGVRLLPARERREHLVLLRYRYRQEAHDDAPRSTQASRHCRWVSRFTPRIAQLLLGGHSAAYHASVTDAGCSITPTARRLAGRARA